MHKHILVSIALDHEELVEKKFKLARQLLADDGRITVLNVLEEVPMTVIDFVDLKPEAEIREHVLKKLKALVGEASDVTCDLANGKPGVAIAEYARKHDVDLIVVGSHKPGAQDLFLGSTAARVVRRAPVSVHVVR
ncbi:MAG: universal stress protein [Pseudomonadota bacterium]